MGTLTVMCNRHDCERRGVPVDVPRCDVCGFETIRYRRLLNEEERRREAQRESRAGEGPVPPGLVPTPGWYRDPLDRASYRFWDGENWHEQRAADHPERPAGAWRATPGSLALTLGGFVVGFGLSILFVLPDLLLGHPGGAPAVLVLSELGLWSGLLGACLLTSRRYGTGSLRRDFHLELRWWDAAIGLGATLVVFVVQAVAAIPVLAAHRVTSNPDEALYALPHFGAFGWVVLVLVVLLGAPVFEELFFRGLLQGQLVRRFRPALAVTVTGVLFGAAHFLNDPGYGGLLLAVTVGAGGVVLGGVRHLTGRLGSSIATHFIWNATAATIGILVTSGVLGRRT